MVVNTLESGRTTNSMVRESTHGQMVDATKETTWMIRKRVTVFTIGLMGENMKVSGKEVNNTVKESSLIAKGRVRWAYG
jgi:hypothetical protein